jgi:hypothetical protein
VQAASVGDGGDFGGYLRELPLGSAEKDEGAHSRRRDDNRHDQRSIQQVLAGNRAGARSDRARCDPAQAARSAGQRMRHEEKLLLERVQRKDQSLSGFRQILELRLQRCHVLTLEAHHIVGSVDRAAGGVDDDYIPWDGLKPVDELGREKRDERGISVR